MTSAANSLLQAIYQELLTDEVISAAVGPDGVRDRLVVNGTLPAIVLGEMVSNDFSTSTELGEEHLLTLQICSETAGRRQAQSLASTIRSLLHDANLPLEGFALVNCLHLSTKSRREPKTKLFVAEMKFRAVTE